MKVRRYLSRIFKGYLRSNQGDIMMSVIANVKRKGEEMDRMHWNRRNIFVMMAWIALIVILIASFFAEASAKEADDISNVTAQESPVQTPPKQKQPVDPVNLAFCGISIGCIMFGASVNRNRTQRKHLETQIQGLDSFLASTCAVEFHISTDNDNDPMISRVKGIQNGREVKLKEYEEHKHLMVRSFSEIETEVMKLWG